MKTIESTPAIDDSQAYADLDEVCRLVSEGKKVTDPELHRRIEVRADWAREETLRHFGVQDIGVEIIRGMRDPKI
jgi:hypothetical protein